MKLGDEYGSDYGQDDEAELRRRLMSSWAPEAAQPEIPVEDTPPPPAPAPAESYQFNTDVPASNESYYQPQAEPPQMSVTGPEPPRAYEGADVTSGNPPAVGQPAPGLPSYAPVLGWDTGKLNSPDAQSEKYQFMRAVQAAGLDPVTATNNPQLVVNAVNAMYPGLGVTVGPGGTINWPGLGPIDFSIDSGKGGWFFDPVNERGAAGPTAAARTTATQPRATAAPQGGSFGVGSGSVSAPQGIWSSDFLAQLRAMLMQRLAAAAGPVDENATGISQAVTGARDQATRQNEASRTALAERLYAQGGLNTDAIGQSVQQSNERTGTALGTLRAQLVMKEYDRKQAELNSLLELAIQSGDAETARMVQMQLAELQAQIQREGIGAQLAMYQQSQNALAGNPSNF
jgi:hypothetical protein